MQQQCLTQQTDEKAHTRVESKVAAANVTKRATVVCTLGDAVTSPDSDTKSKLMRPKRDV